MGAVPARSINEGSTAEAVTLCRRRNEANKAWWSWAADPDEHPPPEILPLLDPIGPRRIVTTRGVAEAALGWGSGLPGWDDAQRKPLYQL